MVTAQKGEDGAVKQPRSTIRSPYMEWAKLCSVAPYNLATSGVTSYPLAELGVNVQDLEINGPTVYGYQPLQERLARKNQTKPECVFAAAGTDHEDFHGMRRMEGNSEPRFA